VPSQRSAGILFDESELELSATCWTPDSAAHPSHARLAVMGLLVSQGRRPSWAGRPAKKNGGPFDPPPVMQHRLVMKVHLPLARQRP